MGFLLLRFRSIRIFIHNARIISGFLDSLCYSFEMNKGPLMELEPQARRNLMLLANAWCAATGNNLRTASQYLRADPFFFANIAKRLSETSRKHGDKTGSFTFRIYDRTVAWFYDPANWPERVRIGKNVDGEPIYRPFRLSDIPEIEDLGHHKRKR
jgi:hypothetical protein